jgi:hypothetical protein
MKLDCRFVQRYVTDSEVILLDLVGGPLRGFWTLKLSQLRWPNLQQNGPRIGLTDVSKAANTNISLVQFFGDVSYDGKRRRCGIAGISTGLFPRCVKLI